MRRKDYGGIEGATVALYHANDLLQEATRLAEDEQLDQFPGGYYTPTSDPARDTLPITGGKHAARMCLTDDEYMFTAWKERYDYP